MMARMIAFLRKLWRFVRPYRSRLVLGLICGVFFAVSQGILLLVIREVINLLFPGANLSFAQQMSKAPGILKSFLDSMKSMLPDAHSSHRDQILVICIIPAVMFVRAIFGYLNVYLVSWAALRSIADLRAALFNHLQNLSLSFFNQARTGDLISRVTNDTQIMYGIVANGFASMIKDPITLVVTVAVLFTKEPMLTLVSIVVLPACIIPIVIYGKKVRKSARDMQGINAELTSLMHESFTGNRVIKAYGLEDAMISQYQTISKKHVSRIMRVIRSNELPSQVTEFLAGLGVALVLIYGVVVVMTRPNAGAITGNFVSFVLAFVLMYPSIKSLTRLHNQLTQAEAASHRVFELLEMKSTIVDPPNPIPLKAANADIHFENIEFAYGEKPVLRGINLTVKAGHLVALVGASGSGKTSLVNLLPRFYDPQRGAVLIGGTDIRQVAIADLRKQMALVTQETILFYDTIRQNIAFGRPGASDAEIEAAARHANAHEFIMQKPDGYNAIVGEKGAALSGGQRQRIAIARAILKNAPILVLDEATNALDAESERAVQDALEELMQNRTTICIAHRLSTIQSADLIVVLHDGRIVESGTHSELIQRAGVYQRLYELQFQS